MGVMVRLARRRVGGAITPIQLRLGSKLPSLRILPPSRGKGHYPLAAAHDLTRSSRNPGKTLRQTDNRPPR